MTKETPKKSASAKSKKGGRGRRGDTSGGEAASEEDGALTELDAGSDAEADVGEPQSDKPNPKSKVKAKAKSKTARRKTSSKKTEIEGADDESRSSLPDAADAAAKGDGDDSSGASSRDHVSELDAAESGSKASDDDDDSHSSGSGVGKTSATDAGGALESDGKKQAESRSNEPEEPTVEIPELIDLNDFQKKPLAEMQRIAAEIGLRVAGVRSKHHLVFEILCWFGRRGAGIEATGLIDIANDSHAFLRWPDLSFNANVDDVYCAVQFLREHKLKPGHLVRAAVRPPREREKFLSVERLLEIEGQAADEWVTPVDFDELTALYPSERLILEYPDCQSPSPRVVDLLAPLGKGQRGLIVAPPRAGKTILLKSIAVSIQKNHPEVELIVLLLDERPEEVTDFRETVDAPVFSSTFDEPSRRHVQVSDMVAERARRLVEQKKDVVILLDSLTRLARGHNINIGSKGGRTGSGGLDTQALQRPRKFFGAARNVEEGGSLTILATCLVETDSRMDEVIFEEFKGTGNMEIYLDRELAEKRIFPAIHGLKSGTRKDELLYHADEFKRIGSLRRELIQLPAGEAMEKLIKNIRLTSSNAELLLRGLSLR